MITEINYQKGITYDKQRGYEHTKVNKVQIWINGEEKLNEKPRTWAKLTQYCMSIIRPEIQKIVEKQGGEKFERIFNKNLSKSIDFSGIKPAVSFSRLLFTDDSYIKSKVYNASENRKIKVYKDPRTGEDKLICAVFSREIIWVLNALVASLKEFNVGLKIMIEYTPREELEESFEEENRIELEEVDFNKLEIQPIEKKELAKDLATVYVYTSRISTMIDKLAEKYGIDVITEIENILK